MNNDLISREALKKRLNEMFETFDVVLFDDIIATIDNAPTVDTTCPHCDSGYAQGYSDGYLRGKEERPQGEWICVTKSTFPQYQPDEYKCPFCNIIVHRKTNYCEYCGADMRGAV